MTAAGLSVIVAAAALIVSIIAIVQTRKVSRDQQRIDILQPRLPAYDSALAIAGQLDRISQVRFIAKLASDQVEESHAITGSVKPNHFAEAYMTYSEELKQEVRRLEELRGQSYFPDEFNQAIGSLLRAAIVRNDVDAEAVNRQQNEIRENFQQIQAIHSEVTKHP